ncbi:sensor histidine kinase [Bacteroides coprosuis]|uniref:sensor histidine kinase n=1 Tax=Bacteroides coprosuis TaxID=151276 RepID=UPI001D43A211|nr:histidine kinase [Bacteroides coprosuis]HJD92273.1 histidine kinase [Bacteroides coprosuis]
MKSLYTKYHWLLNVLLFTGLGCFSYLALVLYTDIPENHLVQLISLKALVTVVFVVNSLGFCLIYINKVIRRSYPTYLKDRIKSILYFFTISVLLLLLNILLLGAVKWSVGIENPFYIRQLSGIFVILTIWLIQIVVVSLTIVNNFYRQMLRLYRRSEILEESAIKAQNRALLSQLNPHFLFNSLNTLIAEISYNPENATLFTRHLSDVYRYILQCENKQWVSLKSELEFLDSFIFLHQVRLGDCIFLENEIPPELIDTKIPPLTLQVLVENIIKHNVISLTKPMSIVLQSNLDNQTISISNRIRPKQEVESFGKGLANLAERYRLLYNKEIYIMDDGDFFIVTIPIIYE